jgi:crotonobetainyl-CoA:carnitine CoA-transferase CaiB-like acyl-CoA transferase
VSAEADHNDDSRPGAGGGPQVLSGLRVLDLSRWVAGEFAAKLFADFGADVIKVEKPGEGSYTRHWGPFPGDNPDIEASALFLHLNTNKRSITLDLHSAQGRDIVLRLARTADAVVESFRPGHLERLGLGPDELRRENPRLVVTRISAFGQDGPYRNYEATGIVLQAMGGPMHATGEATRAPQRKPGLLEHYTVGRAAGEATLAGVFFARRAGTGAVIDVSGQEVLLAGADRRASYLLSAAYSGANAPRGMRSAQGGTATITGPFRASDGYVMVYITNQEFWNRLIRLIGEGSQAFLSKYLNRQFLGDDWDEFISYLRGWFAQRPKIELMERGEAARIPLTAYLGVDELERQPHFRGRGCFVTAVHPVAGRLEYIGPPWRMRGGYRLRRTAPLLGQHDSEVRAELGLGAAGSWPHRSAGRMAPIMRYPLEGIRVADLTVVWSGPGATAFLGDLGAEVIRIEGNNRTSRQVSATVTKEMLQAAPRSSASFPDRDPGARPYDRSAVFNWHSRNKLAACMNLDTPEGHDAAVGLLAICDVLVENNSNGVLERLGLGHEYLLEVNPRLIVARMPPLGMTGPMSGYLGYGPNFNSLVGIAAMDGYEGETPDTAGDNYHMDEASPAGLAFAVIAALLDRAATGKGGLIEFPQAENVMQDIGEFFLDRQLNHRNPQILGNSAPHALQDAYPAAGDDEWVAISVRDDRDWSALTAVLGNPGWARLGMSAAARHANNAVLRARIAEWTRAHPAEVVMAQLQAAGVPAGEVMTETRLLADKHLAARDWFKERSHPSVGTHRYPGHPWRASGFDLAFGRPVPGFGEDNEYVYKTLLGYPDERYDDLVRRGLVTTEQFA